MRAGQGYGRDPGLSQRPRSRNTDRRVRIEDFAGRRPSRPDFSDRAGIVQPKTAKDLGHLGQTLGIQTVESIAAEAVISAVTSAPLPPVRSNSSRSKLLET